MKFSIIVVSYNPGEKLRETLMSIKKQTFKDYEVILKDALSTDDSLNCLSEFEDMPIRLIKGKDAGIYDGMNIALKEASGEFVYFLNCGDYLYSEDVLSTVSEKISEGENGNKDSLRIYYGNIYDRPSKEIIASNPKLDGFGCYRNIPCHQAVFYEKELLTGHPFEIKYKVRADYEHFLWCVYEKKASLNYMDITVADYEGQGFSETGERIKLSGEEHKEITKKYMTGAELFKYKAILTLAPLRTTIARNPKTAGIYNLIKKKLYGKKK